MQYGYLYFYTSTIYKWHPLIKKYNFYSLILDSFSFLHKKGCIRIYGFVIMPNHIHLIWQILQANGKESPVASFHKFTAHHFESYIRKNNPEDLSNYLVHWHTRKYNFWQPEPDWFLLHKESTIIQKLNYLHMNPLQERWNLVNDPVKYPYSSAMFYETGVKHFDFLYDYRDFDVTY